MLFAYFYLSESNKISTSSTKNDKENNLTKVLSGDIIKTPSKLCNNGDGGKDRLKLQVLTLQLLDCGELEEGPQWATGGDVGHSGGLRQQLYIYQCGNV